MIIKPFIHAGNYNGISYCTKCTNWKDVYAEVTINNIAFDRMFTSRKVADEWVHEMINGYIWYITDFRETNEIE